jgi:hypothetical protein
MGVVVSPLSDHHGTKSCDEDAHPPTPPLHLPYPTHTSRQRWSPTNSSRSDPAWSTFFDPCPVEWGDARVEPGWAEGGEADASRGVAGQREAGGKGPDPGDTGLSSSASLFLHCRPASPLWTMVRPWEARIDLIVSRSISSGFKRWHFFD